MYLTLKSTLTLLLVLSLQLKAYAEEPSQPTKVNVLVMSGHDLKRTNWRASFDIKAIKENGLLELFESYHLYVSSNIKLKFKNIPDKIEGLYVRGSTLKSNGEIVVHLSGDFEGVSAENLIYNKLFKNLGSHQLVKQKPYKLNKVPVLVYKVIEDSSNNKIYAAKINNQHIVVSNRRIKGKIKSSRKPFSSSDIRKNIRDFKFNQMNNEGLLVSLQINLESLRKKTEEGSYLFQSEVFNNTNHIVFKVKKDKSRIYFASALGTKNKETAEQINKVILGIVENNIKNNQNINSIKSILIRNLKTTIEDFRVMLKTSIPLNYKNI
jgi:hypothetical protein